MQNSEFTRADLDRLMKRLEEAPRPVEYMISCPFAFCKIHSGMYRATPAQLEQIIADHAAPS